MQDYSDYLPACQDEIDKKFEPKKLLSEQLASAYLRIADWFPAGSPDFNHLFSKYKHVYDCGSYLEFSVGPQSRKLTHAFFCKDRLCPMCNWRRSLKTFGQVSQITSMIEDKYLFLFLTLTVRNVSCSDLSPTIDRMFKGWDKILHSKFYKDSFLGAIRVLEVTYNPKSDTYHPHLHIILAVAPDYFQKRYVPRTKWLSVWQEAYGDRTITQVHVEKIYGKSVGSNPLAAACAEISKYSVKFHKLPSDEVIYTLYDALYHRRLITFSGVFFQARKALKLDDPVDGDLINVDDSVTPDTALYILRFQWACGYSLYKADVAPQK